MWILLFLACETSPDDSAPAESAAPDRAASLPAYSGGSCPAFVEGDNTGFLSAGESRDFILDLPEDPTGKPVIFLWHWLGGDAESVRRAFGWAGEVDERDFILVTPSSCCGSFEWQFTFPADQTNVDLTFFDDLLTCLYDQYQVDLDQVWASGMSAGGLWTTYLTRHRAEWRAATAPFRGGTDPIIPGSPPATPLPVMVTWGGEDDVLSFVDFDEMNLAFQAELAETDHFVVSCNHGLGHTIPSTGPDAALEFLFDHPREVSPEPYADGLPEDFPDYCGLWE